jgi:hypothetical protein
MTSRYPAKKAGYVLPNATANATAVVPVVPVNEANANAILATPTSLNTERTYMLFTKNFIQQPPDYNDYDAVLDTIIRSDKLTNLHYTGYKYVVTNEFSKPSSAMNNLIMVDKDVWFNIEECKINDKSGELTRLTFRIHAKAHTLQHLKDYVSRCRDAYAVNINDKLGTNKTYYFDHITPENFENTDQVIFEQGVFESNKTFDNLFYAEKDIVQQRVEHFINNSEWYKTHGIPHMLGFMLHGLPGTGKTSTIKAMANKTGRHVINVRLSEIKTKTCLKKLFCNETIHIIDPHTRQKDSIHVPINKRLYVVEDIDAMSELVRKREYKNKIPKQDDFNEDEASASASASANDNVESGEYDDYETEAELEKYLADVFTKEKIETKKEAKIKNDRDKVTFSDLLNILDGTLEFPGRMICFTTNHLTVIDSALIRPGRIDMIIEFLNASRVDIQNMMEHFYDLQDMDSELFEVIKDCAISPAKIVQIMFKHMHDPDSALHEISVISKLESSLVSKAALKLNDIPMPETKKNLVSKKYIARTASANIFK